VSSYGEQVIFPSGEEPGPPYGVAVVAQMKSVKGRWSRSGGDSTSWDRALKRLRAGELHYLGLDLIQLNGEARSSHYRHGIDIKVEVEPRPCELSPRARTTRRPCRTC